MKTLVELITKAVEDTTDESYRADETVAQLVGAVQEWLGSDAVTALIEGGDLVCCSDLVREAGRGLSDVPAT
jgi:hypothetical protein